MELNANNKTNVISLQKSVPSEYEPRSLDRESPVLSRAIQQGNTSSFAFPMNSKESLFDIIIVDPDSSFLTTLVKWIESLFPQLRIVAKLKHIKEALNILSREKPDIIFCDAGAVRDFLAVISEFDHLQIVSISDKPQDAIYALRNNICGFISLPLELKEVVVSVRCVLNKLKKRKEKKVQGLPAYLPHNNLIGIPTIEGIEFINIDKIIRCEGLQKCTRVVTIERSDIVSSYNIGKFKELLKSDGFFSCHRSHYINLKFIKKYTLEGYIYFTENSKPVPLARRRKSDFLRQIKHL